MTLSLQFPKSSRTGSVTEMAGGYEVPDTASLWQSRFRGLLWTKQTLDRRSGTCKICLPLAPLTAAGCHGFASGRSLAVVILPIIGRGNPGLWGEGLRAFEKILLEVWATRPLRSCEARWSSGPPTVTSWAAHRM